MREVIELRYGLDGSKPRRWSRSASASASPASACARSRRARCASSGPAHPGLRDYLRESACDGPPSPSRRRAPALRPRIAEERGRALRRRCADARRPQARTLNFSAGGVLFLVARPARGGRRRRHRAAAARRARGRSSYRRASVRVRTLSDRVHEIAVEFAGGDAGSQRALLEFIEARRRRGCPSPSRRSRRSRLRPPPSAALANLWPCTARPSPARRIRRDPEGVAQQVRVRRAPGARDPRPHDLRLRRLPLRLRLPARHGRGGRRPRGRARAGRGADVPRLPDPLRPGRHARHARRGRQRPEGALRAAQRPDLVARGRTSRRCARRCSTRSRTSSRSTRTSSPGKHVMIDGSWRGRKTDAMASYERGARGFLSPADAAGSEHAARAVALHLGPPRAYDA